MEKTVDGTHETSELVRRLADEKVNSEEAYSAQLNNGFSGVGVLFNSNPGKILAKRLKYHPVGYMNVDINFCPPNNLSFKDYLEFRRMSQLCGYLEEIDNTFLVKLDGNGLDKEYHGVIRDAWFGDNIVRDSLEYCKTDLHTKYLRVFLHDLDEKLDPKKVILKAGHNTVDLASIDDVLDQRVNLMNLIESRYRKAHTFPRFTLDGLGRNFKDWSKMTKNERRNALVTIINHSYPEGMLPFNSEHLWTLDFEEAKEIYRLFISDQ